MWLREALYWTNRTLLSFKFFEKLPIQGWSPDKILYVTRSHYLVGFWQPATIVVIMISKSINSLKQSQDFIIVGSDNGLMPAWHQVITCNQSFLIVNWTLRKKLHWNLNQNSKLFIQEYAFENAICKMATIFSFFSGLHVWTQFACGVGVLTTTELTHIPSSL